MLASPHAEAFEFVQMLQASRGAGEAVDIAPAVAFLASEEAGWVTGQLLVADGGHVAQLMARRAPERSWRSPTSTARSRSTATRSGSRSRRCTTIRRTRRSRSRATRLSLAEQGHAAEDRPGVELVAPADPSRADVVLVVEVDDARAEHERLGGLGVRFLAEPYEPPWGGCRFFCVDPDGYLVEIEQPA